MNDWLILIAVALCASAISFTVTIAGMFEGMRNWIYDRSKFFGQLITCPWCFGHYVVFIILAIGWNNIPIITIIDYNGTWFPRLFNYLFTSFSVIGLMGLMHRTLLVAYDPVMKIKAQREINKLKEAKAKAELEKQ